MTVAHFYEDAATNGRAVIEGNPVHPQRWIVRARNASGQASYWQCESASVEIRQVDPAMEVARLQVLRNLGGRPRRKHPLTGHRY